MVQVENVLRKPVITIAPFTLKESARVLANLPARAIGEVSPRPIEHYDISRGRRAGSCQGARPGVGVCRRRAARHDGYAGVEIHDRKGLHGPVHFTSPGSDTALGELWQIRAIDFDADRTLPPPAFKPGRARSQH